MTALNSRKAIDRVRKWLISQAILLSWIHQDRFLVEWQIIRLTHRKVLSMLSMRSFPIQGAEYSILSMQKPQGRKGHIVKQQQQTLKSK